MTPWSDVINLNFYEFFNQIVRNPNPIDFDTVFLHEFVAALWLSNNFSDLNQTYSYTKAYSGLYGEDSRHIDVCSPLWHGRLTFSKSNTFILVLTPDHVIRCTCVGRDVHFVNDVIMTSSIDFFRHIFSGIGKSPVFCSQTDTQYV